MTWQDSAINFVVQYGFQIVGAIVILIVGAMLAKWLGKLADGWLVKHALEPPIRILIVRIIKLVVFALAGVFALDKFGVQIAPLVAGIGVAGVGIGLAMQGVLGNLVAGLTIIFTKPFRVGEYIELLGVYGEVVKIELFSTVLIHPDNSRVTIPNRKIVGEILHNYGKVRQLNLNVDVAYSTDIDKAMEIIRRVLTENKRVLKEPAPVLGINALEDSSINISVKPWVNVPDYVEAQLEIYQSVVHEFRAAQIEIPFPQREIRVLSSPAAS